MEQTTEARSHFLIEGPDMNYKMTGYSEHTIKPGLLSTESIPHGVKRVTFKDGQQIVYNPSSDKVYNLMMGTLSH